MTCAEVLQALLEAEHSVLEGAGEGPLPGHIRTCSRCRSAAEAILEEERALGLALAEEVPPVDLETVLEAAALQENHPAERDRSRLQRAAFTLLPVAAAASLAILFLGGEPPLPGDPYRPPEPIPGLGLEVPEGQNIAVLATNNPDITVLWHF